MKKTRFTIYLLSACCVLLTGCFQIIEDITLNSNGSGTVTYTLNMGESRVKLNSIMLMDSIRGQKVPQKEDIQAKINEVRDAIASQKGIKVLDQTTDFENYIFKLKFEFEHIDNLDLAFDKVGRQFNPKLKDEPLHNYGYSGTAFKRLFMYALDAETTAMADREAELLNSAGFTGIYRFDKPVQGMSHPAGKISKSGKAVMVKVNLKDLLKGDDTIKNEINF